MFSKLYNALISSTLSTSFEKFTCLYNDHCNWDIECCHHPKRSLVPYLSNVPLTPGCLAITNLPSVTID